MLSSILRVTLACLVWSLLGGVTQAAEWPLRPIRIIVPYPPGGPSDIVLRNASAAMQATLGQPVILDNKPGAGGNLGAAEAARAQADGYTWFWATDSVVTVNPHVYERLSFKLDDLVPVTVASSFSQTLVCNPSLGVKTLAELIEKARGQSLDYASGGAGVPGHLAMELLLASAGVKMTHIPYKGPAPAAQDVIGGQVHCGFLAGPTVLPHVRSGRLVALAVSGTRPSAVLPEVPTVAQAGFPEYDATFFLLLFAPRGMPAAIVEAMHGALTVALKAPDLVEKLRQTDQEVVAGTQAEAAVLLRETSRKWGDVARRIGLRLD